MCLKVLLTLNQVQPARYHPPPNQFQTSNTNESGAFRSFVFLRKKKKHIEIGKESQERQGFSPITELTSFKHWPYWRVGYWGEGPRNAKIGLKKIYLTIVESFNGWVSWNIVNVPMANKTWGRRRYNRPWDWSVRRPMYTALAMIAAMLTSSLRWRDA